MNLKSLSIDNGYGYIKVHPSNVKFKSTVKLGVDNYNEDVIQVEYDNQNYIVGENNNSYNSDQDKLTSRFGRNHFIVSTLVSIGLSYKTEKDIEIDLCLGTPSEYFEKQKEGIVQLLKGKEFKIKINKVGMEQHIKINRVMVLPQGLAPIITNKRYSDSRVVVIDVGSGTIDVSEIIKGKLQTTLTLEKGCIKLYSKIAKQMNKEFGTKFNSDDVETMVQDRVFIVNGESRSIDKYIEDIKYYHTLDFINDIKQANFDLQGNEVVLIGGGAILLETDIRDIIPHAKLEHNSQNANVEAYDKILKMKLK